MTGEKRMSRTFSVKGFYTFGKGLDMINTQASTAQVPTDWNNIDLDRGRANGDRRHSMVISGIWELKYFRNAPFVVRAIAGGWAISAIASMRSGTPLTVTSGNDRNFDGNGNDRPDLIGDPFLSPNRPRNQVVDMWFNPAAFNGVTSVSRSFDGTAPRNFIDGPGLKNVDMGIFREFRAGERYRLQFRAESTNAFNLVNLSSPVTSISSTTTVGKITTARPMRQVQLGLRLSF